MRRPLGFGVMDSDIESKQWEYLKSLCETVLTRRPLIVVSNRGPLQHHLMSNGRIEVRKGSGGVVTALNTLTQMLGFTWISSAMGDQDRKADLASQGEPIKSTLPGQRINVRFVPVQRRSYHKFYNIFCNPLLWFLQHHMWNSPYNPNVDLETHDSWINGYTTVNEAFSKIVLEESNRHTEPPIVMSHDYHLYLTPGYIRKDLPNAIIQHFIHIPWPSPSYWHLLPSYMRESICRSLCDADVVGFQSMKDVRNFLSSCEEFLTDIEIDHNDCSILIGGHRCRARAYPLSINVGEIRSIADNERALQHEQQLSAEVNKLTIARIDRVEPSRNIIRGFLAYRLLLTRYPELHGKVTFLAFLVPSRTHIRQYKRYLDDVEKTIEEINTTFGNADWLPIKSFVENNYTLAIAGMKLYDVLLSNPVIDGMNLVSKEGPVVNKNHGVLILSEGAGAHNQLRHGSLTVSPTDIEGTMQAMYKALTMSVEERQHLSGILVESIEKEDIIQWIANQMDDLVELM